MYKSETLVNSLLRLGLQLGYHDNLRHTLYHLTGVYAPEDIEHTEVSEWLSICIQAKLSNISAISTTHSTLASDRALKISVPDSMRLSLSPSISVTLERDTDAIVCCIILQNMLKVPDIVSAQEIYQQTLTTLPNKLVDKYGHAYYDFTIRQILPWEQRHLKHLWRAWGHVHFV